MRHVNEISIFTTNHEMKDIQIIPKVAYTCGSELVQHWVRQWLVTAFTKTPEWTPAIFWKNPNIINESTVGQCWPKPPCQRVFVKAVVTYAVTRLFLKQWCHIINWTLWTYNFHWKMHFKMSDSLLQNGSHLSHPQCVKKPSPCTIRCPKMNQDTMPLA